MTFDERVVVHRVVGRSPKRGPERTKGRLAGSKRTLKRPKSDADLITKEPKKTKSEAHLIKKEPQKAKK